MPEMKHWREDPEEELARLIQTNELTEFCEEAQVTCKMTDAWWVKYQKDDYSISDDLLGKFGIKDDELENIFDVIAKSNPEL